MEENIKLDKLRIGGMTCVSCENKIRGRLSQLEGIKKVEVSYSKASVDITYNPTIISLEKIIDIIEELDYQVLKNNYKVKQSADASKILGAIIIIFALYIIMRQFGLVNLFNAFPQAEEKTSYGMLFVIGLLTSAHCVAMCGGINLSQCLPQTQTLVKQSRFDTLRPSALYNLGRVISYTIIGGLVGALGSVVSFSGSAKGIVQLLAGVFMVIMGLNMLNIFPGLRKFNPRIPNVFLRKAKVNKKGKGSLYVGLLNGLMPCGPLQAMQLYALSTGDPLKGAFSMFLFSLGTVPLMFGLGALSSFMSKKFTNRLVNFGAVLVLILGISMFNNGLALSGYSLDVGSPSNSKGKVAQIEEDTQIVSTLVSSSAYEPITVQVGIPVKWTINAKSGTLNGCNNEIIINEYGIEKKLKIGENIIEFTPTKTGNFTYSCWMGMIRSTITVVEE